MRRLEEQQEFLKLLRARPDSGDLRGMRDDHARSGRRGRLRGGTPPREDLLATVAEAERTLADLARVREEVERLLGALGS